MDRHPAGLHAAARHVPNLLQPVLRLHALVLVARDDERRRRGRRRHAQPARLPLAAGEGADERCRGHRGLSASSRFPTLRSTTAGKHDTTAEERARGLHLPPPPASAAARDRPLGHQRAPARRRPRPRGAHGALRRRAVAARAAPLPKPASGTRRPRLPECQRPSGLRIPRGRRHCMARRL